MNPFISAHVTSSPSSARPRPPPGPQISLGHQIFFIKNFPPPLPPPSHPKLSPCLSSILSQTKSYPALLFPRVGFASIPPSPGGSKCAPCLGCSGAEQGGGLCYGEDGDGDGDGGRGGGGRVGWRMGSRNLTFHTFPVFGVRVEEILRQGGSLSNGVGVEIYSAPAHILFCSSSRYILPISRLHETPLLSFKSALAISSPREFLPLYTILAGPPPSPPHSPAPSPSPPPRPIRSPALLPRPALPSPLIEQLLGMACS